MYKKLMAAAGSRFGVIRERNYLIFVSGYSISYIFYWVTLLAIGWWMWETTKSAAWVGFVFFCDLFPSLFVTPWASTLADRGDRFLILRTVLWVQVFLGLILGALAYFGLLTPLILIAFVLIDGALVGFSQPAFFGMINRIVTSKNLASAVAFNTSVTQFAYILGPLLAGFIFSFGISIAPLAFALNAIGVLFYLFALSMLVLSAQPEREAGKQQSLGQDIVSGISIFWRNKIVFSAIVLIIGCALLQRPLLSLMTGINDAYDLFSTAYFTLLAASFTMGSITASLLLAARNQADSSNIFLTVGMFALTVLYALLFSILEKFSGATILACGGLYLLGFGESFIRTSNTIILQIKTPEKLRSRVLGNTFMLSRATGAIAVAAVGFAVEYSNFTIGMSGVAVAVFVFVSIGMLLVYFTNKETDST